MVELRTTFVVRWASSQLGPDKCGRNTHYWTKCSCKYLFLVGLYWSDCTHDTGNSTIELWRIFSAFQFQYSHQKKIFLLHSRSLLGDWFFNKAVVVDKDLCIYVYMWLLVECLTFDKVMNIVKLTSEELN